MSAIDGAAGGSAPATGRSADLEWDPYDETLKDDPHPLWRRIRDEAPVYYNERYDFYGLSRFADVEWASRQPALFSSAHGTVLEMMTPEPMQYGLMIFLDPPDHTRLRRLVSRAFTPRRVAELDDDIRTICTDLLDRLEGRTRFDFVADFGARLPATVIASLFGVPSADRDTVRHHIDRMFHLEAGVGIRNDVVVETMGWLHSYFTDQLQQRVGAPGDDMMTDLVRAEITDAGGTVRRLTVREATDFALLLVSAGTETVARLLGWAGLLLAEHPDQQAALAADPGLIPDAIEELLRYEAPSPTQGRWLTEAVELHGRTIPADSRIILMTGAAGRDERAYPDPDRFDVRRRFDQHLSFGYGIHFCIGAALARAEGRIALEETLKRYPRWHAERSAATPLHTSTVRGYSHVPVEAY